MHDVMSQMSYAQFGRPGLQDAELSPPVDPVFLEITREIDRCNERFSLCLGELDALADRIFGPVPQCTEEGIYGNNAKIESSLGSLRSALSVLNARIDRLVDIRSRLLTLA